MSKKKVEDQVVELEAQEPAQLEEKIDEVQATLILHDDQTIAEAEQDQPQEQQQEPTQEEPTLDLPSYTSIPEYRWSDANGRIYQLDHQGRGIYALRIVG